MKLAEILSGPDKWVQGFSQPDGMFCLVMALSALHGGRTPDAEYLRLRNAIHASQGGAHTHSSWVWNDEPGRTWEEVAAVVEAYDRDRMLNP